MPKSYPIYLSPDTYTRLLDLRIEQETPGETVSRILDKVAPRKESPGLESPKTESLLEGP